MPDLTVSADVDSLMNCADLAAMKTLLGVGKVLQVARATHTAHTTTTASIPMDDTIPQESEGDEIMTLAVTPLSASSTLLIGFFGTVGHSAANGRVALALFQAGTADALHATMSTCPGAFNVPASLVHYVASGSTSARTYAVRFGVASGTGAVNGTSAARLFGGVASCELIALEIAP